MLDSSVSRHGCACSLVTICGILFYKESKYQTLICLKLSKHPNLMTAVEEVSSQRNLGVVCQTICTGKFIGAVGF